jgi:uncharacterized integral membrane protein (TIGR00697 family)
MRIDIDTVALSKIERRRELVYLGLVGTFLLALIVANVFAASKLIQIDLGFHTVVVAAGILTYPITFLVTDLISEVYGKERAEMTVWIGLAVSVGLVALVQLGKAVPALDPVQQEQFSAFFSSTGRAVAASMCAYLVAQWIDVQLFHFWKRLTHGRHLWLRNNGSTIGSQLVDTIVVTTALFWGTSPPFMNGQVMGVDEIAPIIRDGFIFKGIVALLDTPLFYLGVAVLSRVLRSPEPPPTTTN